MPYTVANAKNDLAGIIHGKTPNKVTTLYSAFRRAGNKVVASIDPDETRQIETLTLYDKVVDVAAPTGLKEKGILDIRPQFNANNSRSSADNLSSRYSKEFDMRRKWLSAFTVMDVNGTKYLRVNANITPAALTLDALDSATGWAATASAQNLAAEDIIYSQGALQFDMAAGANPTTGYIQSSTIESQDLTDYVNKSAAFFEIYIPTAAVLAAIVSLNLRWGNDNTTNYYTRTVTAANFGALKVGRNTIRVDWNGATLNGTVNAAAIDSARITVTTDGTAIAGLIVSNLFFSIGKIWDIEYYSKFLFKDGTTGVWKDTVSSDEDIINLDTASYNIFIYELALACLQQIQGRSAQVDRQYFNDELYGNSSKNIEGLYPAYRRNNPSQREKVTQSYYSNTGWRRSNGGYNRGIRR